MIGANGGGSRMSNKEKILGIDLGTTNSCVAVIEGGKPIVIPNTEGGNTTPSVVGFDKSGTRLVGMPAKRQAVKHPERTISSIKRHIGTDYRVPIDHMTFSPEQISASILQKLKLQAQTHLGEKVTKAIVTVPAYFDDSQRLATRHAGEIAGLEVLRVVNEPTACALAYGFARTGQEANIVIFDFGGGTFDVSILQLSDGVLQVKATNGNNRLGGDDFDQWLVDWMLDQFRAQNGHDLSTDPVAMQRLREAAEKAKIELSGLPSTKIELPFLSYAGGDPQHLNLDLTVDQFNQITQDLVEATARPIENALRDAKLTADQVHHVVLAGGTTRVPSVQKFIKRFFNKEPAKSVNPDEAVAIGAAIQGAILTGEIQEVLLLDVIPITMGVEQPDGSVLRIIDRNTTIPVVRKRVFPTTSDSQTTMKVHVVQGESDTASDCISLAQMEISGIPAGPKGSQSVEVSFEVDADGIVNCKSKVGDKVESAIVLKRTRGFTREELEKLKKEEATLVLKEARTAQRVAAANKAETSLSEVERFLAKMTDQIESEKVVALRSAMTSLRAALTQADAPEIEFLERKLNDARKALD
jgi:molecular chaperone DnaK